MVWIMSLPAGFGEFWPDGEFEDGDNPSAIGWSGRLKAHIKALPSESRKDLMASGDWFDYAYYVSHKFIREVGSKSDPDLPPIMPVLAHEAPTSFHTTKSYKVLGDFIMLNDRIVAVSKEMKDLISDLDGEAHQYFPIDLVQPRSATSKKFYTLVISNFRDSFEDVDGAMPDLPSGARYTFGSVNKKEAQEMHFRKSACQDVHLWRERTFNEEVITLSDELAARIQEAGLSTPKMYQATEIA